MNKRIKRILKITGITILSVVLIFAGVFTGMFHREVRTLNSIEKLDEHPLYTMEYKGDYGMDEFLEVGACNDQELVKFVVDRLLKGLPLEINIPSLGCSTFLAKNEESDGYLFGRNFDLNASPGMFVRTQPEDGYASISMVNLGFIGYTLKEQNGIVNSEEAMDLLQAASQDPHRTDDGDISATQWSVVYDMETLSATICMGQDYENTYTYSVAEPEK